MEIRTATRAKGLGELPPLSGAHIVHFYTSEAERREALLDFIQCGTDRGERTLCITEKPTDEMLQEFLQGQDPEDGSFLSMDRRSFYLYQGVFDHDRIYRKWLELFGRSRERGFTGVRALGDVLPELEQMAGGKAVIIYELNINKVFQLAPPSCVVCQYDARSFRGETLIGILRAHPLVLKDGGVYANPLFEPSNRITSH
jgi:hypothetical protein